MTNRMTGISGLIDTDALVEATLLRQKTKINTATQNLKIQQYKQEQYRTIMTQAKSFYNNYFDILSGNSLAATKAYNIMSAKSSDSNSVTATATTKAKTANYEVSITNKATAAKYQMDKSTLESTSQITINNVAYNITGSTAKERAENLNAALKNNNAGVTASYSDFVNNGAGGLVLETKATGADAELSVYLTGGHTNNITASDSSSYAISKELSFDSSSGSNSLKVNGKTINVDFTGLTTADEKAQKITDALDAAGLAVKATTTGCVSGGFKLEATTAGTSFNYNEMTNPLTAQTVTSGTNATYAQTDAYDISTIMDDLVNGNAGNVDYFNINGVELGLSATDNDKVKDLASTYNDMLTDTTYSDDDRAKAKQKVAEALANGLNNAMAATAASDGKHKLSGDLCASSEDGVIKFTSKHSGELTSLDTSLNCSINGGPALNTTNGENATNAESTLSATMIASLTSIADNNNSLVINGKTITYEKATTGTEAEKLEANKTALQNALKDAGIDIDYSNNTLTSRKAGTAGNFTATIRNNVANGAAETVSADTDVTNAVGKVIKGKNANVKITNKDTGLSYDYNGNANQITLDEVTFNIKDAPSDGSKVTINVKPDGSELKDKIVDFINEYNSLLGAINTKLYEEYDRSYKPLTDDDKEGLTDGQIEKLEKKAQTGLLRNDSYLTDFADQMKSAMSSIMKNSGLSLERIGITPKKDYTTENGLFEIDEDKLLSAIEKDPDGIKDLFLKGIANNSVSNDDGIMSKMTDIMKKQVVNFDSIFARRAGFSTGTYATINEMTLDIKDRQKKISELQDAYNTKEDLLYKKYASLESSLASLQSQQSSLSSYFG